MTHRHLWIGFCLSICLLFGFAIAGRGEQAAAPGALTAEQRRELEAKSERLWEEANKLDGEGKLAEAIARGLQALAIERKVFGSVHDEIAGSLDWLATNYERRDDFGKAQAARLEQLRILRQLHGEQHWLVTSARLGLEDLKRLTAMSAQQRRQLRTADAKHEEALRLYGEGKYPEALRGAQETLALRKAILGEAHPGYAVSLMNVASAYQALGDHARAEPLFRKATEINKKALGEQHPDYATSLNNLAFLYQTMGDNARVEPLYREAIEVNKKAHGEEHPEYAASLSTLATFLYDAMSDYARAEPLYVEALEIQKKTLGEQDGEYLKNLTELAFLYEAKGDYARAEPLHRQVVEIQKKALGEQDPVYAVSLSNLAFVYQAMSDHARSEPLYVQALAIQKTAVGEEHPNYVDNLSKLATLYEAMGDYARAEPLYRQALEIQKKAGGEAHPNYAKSLHSLALVYRAMGDNARAEPLCRQALEIRRKTLGETHPDYAISLTSLALIYQSKFDYARAEPAFRQAADIVKVALGEAHPAYATCLSNLSSLYQAMGDYARAEPLAQQSLKITKQAFGEEHPEYASGAATLAAVYATLGKYAEAEQLFRQALAIHEKTLGKGHPDYAISLHNLASMCVTMGDYAKAEPLYRQAVDIVKNTLGEEHPNFAMSLHALASLYMTMGDVARAEPLCRQALGVRKKALGEAHPDYAKTLSMLAHVLRITTRDNKQAEALYQQAMEIRKRALGETHPAYGASLYDLGTLYESMGEYLRAEPLFRRALDIDKASFGEKSPDYASSLINLAGLYDTMGELKKSEEHLREGLAISRDVVERAAAGQSERQQLAMAETLRHQLISYLVRATVPAFRDNAYAQMLAWKGAVLARQRAVRAVRDKPELEPIYREKERITALLARQSFAVPPEAQRSAWQKQIAELSDQKERLERQLASASSSYRQSMQAITLESLRAALPEDGVLIDIFESDVDVLPFGAGAPLPPDANSEATGQRILRGVQRRYLAFLVRKIGPIELVLLDNPKEAESQLEVWRTDFGQSAPTRAAGLWLREHIWQPLEERLAGTKLVLISLDGALGKLPFAALPGREPGSYLLEERERLIAVIPSAAALPTLTTDAVAKQGVKSLLVVGGVNYNRAGPVDSASTLAANLPKTVSRAPRDSQVLFDPLPGTQEELATIKSTYESRGFDTSLLTTLQQDAATELALRAAAPQHKYLHFATHGFFAAASFKSALDRSTQGEKTLGQDGLASEQSISGYHPNLLSGIVLAGANQPPDEGDDGILTAEEVETLDLRVAELVVLSACETGVGKTAGGEGLLGLQRAFQGAGAKTVVASLWSVPDQATRTLMVRFYENLWNKKMGKLEALREAQLWMLEHGAEQPGIRRELAARGLAAAEGTGDRSQGTGNARLPPYYWAAWVLSGDWR